MAKAKKKKKNEEALKGVPMTETELKEFNRFFDEMDKLAEEPYEEKPKRKGSTKKAK